jgi:hypothetical protein
VKSPATLLEMLARLPWLKKNQILSLNRYCGHLVRPLPAKKNLAQQLRHSSVVALLSESLAEEENADQLLNQVARTLMSVAKMRAAIEQAAEEEA